MGRRELKDDVFQAALSRLRPLFGDGHRVVVSFSAGKDSGICLELCLEAAREMGRLPLDVVMRDEEIMFPGTYEYAERVARREEVSFHWLIASQPIINIYNRAEPYWWTFDTRVSPEDWVRKPPGLPSVEQISELHIDALITPERFPPAPEKRLIAVIGLRCSESRFRLAGIHSSGGHLTKPQKHGVIRCRPIYDWEDSDVWRAISLHGWDYNHAYDVMVKMGLKQARHRIAPVTMNALAIDQLQPLAGCWPEWFDRVCRRLPGIRSAAHYGRRAVEPQRRQGETWEECYDRTCVAGAPAPWIAERAAEVRSHILSSHAKHAETPLPEVKGCRFCPGGNSLASWKQMAKAMYSGDPFSFKAAWLPYMEPSFFRPDGGEWGGSPTW